MSEIKFFELKCQRCGGELERRIESGAEIYVCKSCGKTFEKQIVSDVADQLRSVLDEQKQEAVANLRQQLWAEMHEQYINSAKIVELSRGIKKYLPDDYFANFCEIANSGNDKQVNAFLRETSKENMSDYADVVLDFMLKSLRAANITELTNFIEKAFKGDTKNYDKYTTKLETEAEKVNSGIYELTLTRDVFLAYSSADMDRVIELCEFLESNGLTCFLALRNLRHGREAVDNYDKALKTAIDNCKTVVFVSSTNSRSLECDALTKELPYIKQKDLEAAPPEFKRAYDRLPQEYMMPRVQYLLEEYVGDVAEYITKEFFHDNEWCKSKEAVAQRVTKYITEVHETTAQKAEREKREEERKRHETEEKLIEAQRQLAEAQQKAAEAEKARIEAEKFMGDHTDSKTFNDEKRQSRIKADFDIRDTVVVKYKGKGGDVEIPDFILEIENEAFKGTSIKNVIIPNCVESIGDRAFEDCNAMENIVIGAHVAQIGSNVFSNCNSLVNITVDSRNKKYKSIDGNLYSHDGKTLIKYAIGKRTNSFIIPDSVEVVNDQAFLGCVSLNSITIPKSVNTIGKEAFMNCTSLLDVTIPANVQLIGDSAFSCCSSMRSVIIEDYDCGYTKIGEYAFYLCGSLKSVVMGGSVCTISMMAFCQCTSLTSIIIPKNVFVIEKYVFNGCKNLKTIYCRTKKPLLGLPKHWDKDWIADNYDECKAKVIWNYKG